MWSSITGCLGPIVGAWACNRYPLLALSICPSLLFFAQAVMFATGPETLPVAERKPFSPGSANAFGSLRLLFANGVGLRCEEKPSASNSRSWGLKHRGNRTSGSSVQLTEGCSLGRRRLTIASGIFQGCTSNWGIREPFRAAALNWTPSQSAYFDSVNFGWNCARKDVLDRVYLMLALAQPGS